MAKGIEEVEINWVPEVDIRVRGAGEPDIVNISGFSTRESRSRYSSFTRRVPYMVVGGLVKVDTRRNFLNIEIEIDGWEEYDIAVDYVLLDEDAENELRLEGIRTTYQAGEDPQPRVNLNGTIYDIEMMPDGNERNLVRIEFDLDIDTKEMSLTELVWE